jgi:hypothetical protein
VRSKWKSGFPTLPPTLIGTATPASTSASVAAPRSGSKGLPGTPEFLKAYEDALQAIRMGKYPKPKGAKGKGLYDAPKADTLRGLVHLFEQSAEAKGSSENS